MITLGIETSCDETSCAVLRGPDALLSNVVSSSLKQHQAYGGVVPEIASRKALEGIDVVFKIALKEAKIRREDIGLIAVTYGPGLVGSLLVGVSFAKALSYCQRVPLVGVNHLEAHLDANFIESKKPKKPFVGLVVSGGHTALVVHEDGKYRLLGETIDDAAGEAYDKVAKILGLGFPGGPEIDRLAALGNAKRFPFTKPKFKGGKSRFQFSFSGIKTAVLQLVRELPGDGRDRTGVVTSPGGTTSPLLSESDVRDICASFQEAVVSWLVEKTMDACLVEKSRLLVMGGGVAANSLLRKRLAEEAKKRKIRLYIPPLKFTGDNAAMVARSGYERFVRFGPTPRYLHLTPDPNLGIGE